MAIYITMLIPQDDHRLFEKELKNDNLQKNKDLNLFLSFQLFKCIEFSAQGY